MRLDLTGGNFANGAAFAAFASILQEGLAASTRRNISPPRPKINIDFEDDFPGMPEFESESMVLDDSGTTVPEPPEVTRQRMIREVLHVDQESIWNNLDVDIPGLSKVSTGVSFSRAELALGAAESGRAGLERGALMAVGAPLVVAGVAGIGGVPALVGAAEGVAVNAIIQYSRGNNLTGSGFLYSAGAGALTGGIGGALVNASGGGVAANVVWGINQRAADASLYFIGQGLGY